MEGQIDPDRDKRHQLLLKADTGFWVPVIFISSWNSTSDPPLASSYSKRPMRPHYVQTTVPGVRQGCLCSSSSPGLECLPPTLCPHLSTKKLRL